MVTQVGPFMPHDFGISTSGIMDNELIVETIRTPDAEYWID